MKLIIYELGLVLILVLIVAIGLAVMTVLMPIWLMGCVINDVWRGVERRIWG